MWLVSCGNELKLHNCRTYEVDHVYRPNDYSGQIRNISWCKDGSWLALVPSRGNAEIIRTKDDMRLLQSILGVTQPTVAVFQKTTKKNLAMSTLGGELFVYDIKSRGIKKQFTKTSASSIICMDWSVKDTHLVTGNTLGEVVIYSNTTNQKSCILTLPGCKSVSVARFHTTQRSILGTASDEGVVVVWDINGNKTKLSVKSHQAPVTDMVFSSQNCNLMISVGLDRCYQCYDINAGATVLSVMADHPLSTVDMAADGYTISVGSSRGSIYVYDLREHQKPLAIIAAHTGEVKKLLYQPFAICSESINLTEEKTSEITHNLEVKKSSSIDSFGLNMVSEFCTSDSNLIPMEQDTNNKLSESAGGDSFFNYLDMNNCEKANNYSGNLTQDKSELSGMGISDSIKKWLDSKQSVLVDGYEGLEKVSDSLPVPTGKPAASTPQYNKMGSKLTVINQEMNSTRFSSVLGNSSPSISTDELNLIKNAVSDVIANQMSDLMDSLSRHFLNLQLSFSKQFVNQEMEIERLTDYLQNVTLNSNLGIQNQQLTEENEFLKCKINELMKR